MRRALPALLSIVAVAYPLAVYYGLQFWQPRAIGLLLALLFGLRLLLSRNQLSVVLKPLLPVMMLAIVCSLGAALLNSHASLRLTPAFINFSTLAVFALTLWRGPPMIERFARIRNPDLDASGVSYTRKATWAWCLFFLFNGSIALYTAFFSTLEFWTLYNGLIAYLLIGLFAAGEYLIRRWVKRARRIAAGDGGVEEGVVRVNSVDTTEGREEW